MKVKVVIHETEEGGYWAEVPAIRDRASQEQLLRVCAQSSRMRRDRGDGQGGRAQPS